MIGNRIVNSRPFSSYSSSRGGFDFAVFAKCIAVALIVIALPLVLIGIFSSGERGAVKFTAGGFVICTILVPLQCVAEEYIFRGHLLQMFGSWIKFPIIPILLQTVFFAAAHPYNITGVISVALMGIVLGFCAYFTNGLEAGCAMHIINNMVAFYLTGFGFGSVKTEVEVMDLIIVTVLCCVYLAFVIFADKKLGWFNRIKKDSAAEFNAKIEAKKQPVK
jgi:membrane protease YdiL (CAAX protease family)